MRVLIFLVLLAVAIAAPENVQRIIGGSPTTIELYPFMANMHFLYFNVHWSQWCGGTVLTTTVVLSAAHCYYGDIPAQWRVRLGSTQSYLGGANHQISKFTLHPEYEHSLLKNDVALVTLLEPAIFSDSINSASIVGSNVVVPDGTVVVAMGWGDISINGPGANFLQHVEMNVINQELCTERYAYLKTQPNFDHWPDVDNGMICTGVLDVGGRDTCQGDSGGPVVLGFNRTIVVGITSWGFQCGHEFYPGVNARVSYYSDWIRFTPA